MEIYYNSFEVCRYSKLFPNPEFPPKSMIYFSFPLTFASPCCYNHLWDLKSFSFSPFCVRKKPDFTDSFVSTNVPEWPAVCEILHSPLPSILLVCTFNRIYRTHFVRAFLNRRLSVFGK